MDIPSATEDRPEVPAPLSETPEARPGAQHGHTLRSRVIRGSVWTLMGFAAAQVLRLAGNVVLARLLFPDAFGVMALVNVALQGLELFTDLGLSPGIVQNPRGAEPSFLRTAWTMQTGRGLMLWMASALLAWPFARFYNEPTLLLYIPVAGSSAFISSLSTTNLFLANRKLELGKLTLIDLTSQAVALASMIGWVWFWPSIWALVGGRIVAALTKCVLSHWAMPQPRMWFEFHRDIARELFHFGKWIFLATVLTFLVTRADRLVLGKILTLGDLGVYFVAALMANTMQEVVGGLSGRVLFPLCSETARRQPAKLRKQLARARTGLLALTLPPMWVLIIWGPEIIKLLYDERYQDAGWVLQWLSASAAITIIYLPSTAILLAVGDSRSHLMVLVFRSVITLGTMGLFGFYYGLYGVIASLVVAPLLTYPSSAYFVRRHGAWLPLLDGMAIAISAAAVSLGLFVLK